MVIVRAKRLLWVSTGMDGFLRAKSIFGDYYATDKSWRVGTSSVITAPDGVSGQAAAQADFDSKWLSMTETVSLEGR